jgi:hypothetical protein
MKTNFTEIFETINKISNKLYLVILTVAVILVTFFGPIQGSMAQQSRQEFLSVELYKTKISNNYINFFNLEKQDLAQLIKKTNLENTQACSDKTLKLEIEERFFEDKKLELKKISQQNLKIKDQIKTTSSSLLTKTTLEKAIKYQQEIIKKSIHKNQEQQNFLQKVTKLINSLLAICEDQKYSTTGLSNIETQLKQLENSQYLDSKWLQKAKKINLELTQLIDENAGELKIDQIQALDDLTKLLPSHINTFEKFDKSAEYLKKEFFLEIVALESWQEKSISKYKSLQSKYTKTSNFLATYN